jgi:hypothetical protein
LQLQLDINIIDFIILKITGGLKMEIDKAKLKDYATTFALMAVGSVVAYQGAIMGYVPAEYSVIALIGFGILSQVAANSRVKDALVKGNDVIDQYQAKIEELQKQVDAYQATVHPIQDRFIEEEKAA